MQFEYDLGHLVITWANMFRSRAKLITFMNKLFSLFQTHLQRVRGALPQPHQRLSTCAQGHRVHGVRTFSQHSRCGLTSRLNTKCIPTCFLALSFKITLIPPFCAVKHVLKIHRLTAGPPPHGSASRSWAKRTTSWAGPRSSSRTPTTSIWNRSGIASSPGRFSSFSAASAAGTTGRRLGVHTVVPQLVQVVP